MLAGHAVTASRRQSASSQAPLTVFFLTYPAQNCSHHWNQGCRSGKGWAASTRHTAASRHLHVQGTTCITMTHHHPKSLLLLITKSDVEQKGQHFNTIHRVGVLACRTVYSQCSSHTHGIRQTLASGIVAKHKHWISQHCCQASTHQLHCHIRLVVGAGGTG
jgi:hypothetical protein